MPATAGGITAGRLTSTSMLRANVARSRQRESQRSPEYDDERELTVVVKALKTQRGPDQRMRKPPTKSLKKSRATRRQQGCNQEQDDTLPVDASSDLPPSGYLGPTSGLSCRHPIEDQD